MEFLDGESLPSYLKQPPQPPMILILEIIEQNALGSRAAESHAGSATLVAAGR